MSRYMHSTASVAVFMVCFALLFASVAVHAQSDNVTLWNTLGSDTEIINSEVGPGGARTGGYFAPGPFPSFGQAFVNADPRAFALTFPVDSVVSMSKGTVAFWAKLNNFPSALFDGIAPLAWLPNSTFGLNISFASNDGCGGGGLRGNFGVSTDSFCTGTVDTGTQAYWQSGGSLDDILGDRAAWHHYAMVWNEMGISQLGGRKLYLYLDGNLVATPYYQDRSPWGSIPSGSRLVLAYFFNITGVTVAVDNLIVWDDVKTDFSDRFDENPGGQTFSNFINDKVNFVVQSTSLSTTPVSGGPAGVYTITARLTNKSPQNIWEPIKTIVNTLTNGNKLLSASEGNGGAGSKQAIDAGTDDILLPNESATVRFRIGLANRNRFTFFVDIWGTVNGGQ